MTLDTHQEPDICLICRDILDDSVVMPNVCQCKVKYHPNCLEDIKKKNNLSCPICRIKCKPNQSQHIITNFGGEHYLYHLAQREWNLSSTLSSMCFLFIHFIFSIILTLCCLVPYFGVHAIIYRVNLCFSSGDVTSRPIRNRAFLNVIEE